MRAAPPGLGLLATSGRHRPDRAANAEGFQGALKTSGLRPEPRPSSEMPPRITSSGTTRATSLPGRGQGRSSGRALHLVPVRGGRKVGDCPTRRSPPKQLRCV